MSTLLGRRGGSWVFPVVLAVAVVAGVLAQSDQSPIRFWVFLLVVAGWVVSLCLHEFAHAMVALAGGDSSVRARGYLTLNPLRYTNVTNSLVMPLIALAIGGFPLPGGAVLIETHRLRARWWSSAISAAGPLTNFLAGAVLSAVSASLASRGDGPTGLSDGLAFLAELQFVTAILNILPVPGFDGFGIIAPYLSASTKARIAPIQPWAPLIFFALLISIPQARTYLFDPAQSLFALFGGHAGDPGDGQILFFFWR